MNIIININGRKYPIEADMFRRLLGSALFQLDRLPDRTKLEDETMRFITSIQARHTDLI